MQLFPSRLELTSGTCSRTKILKSEIPPALISVSKNFELFRVKNLDMSCHSRFENSSFGYETKIEPLNGAWNSKNKVQPLRIATKPPFSTNPLGNKANSDCENSISQYDEEPSTPKAQVLSEGYFESRCRTPMTVPQLTPDEKTPFSGNACRSSSNSSSRDHQHHTPVKVPRKPVPSHGTNFLGSPFRPSGKEDRSHSNFGSCAKPLEAPIPHVCGFCDMPMDAAFRSESIVVMSCGHYAHKECYDNLASLCASSDGNMTLTCMICGSAVGPADSVSILKPLSNVPGSEAFDGIKSASDKHKDSALHLTPISSHHSDDLSKDSPCKLSQILASDCSQLQQLHRKESRMSLGGSLSSVSSASSSSLDTSIEQQSILEESLPLQPHPSSSSVWSQSPTSPTSESFASDLMDHGSPHSVEHSSGDSAIGQSGGPLFKKISKDLYNTSTSHSIPLNTQTPDLRVSCFVAQSGEDQQNRSKAALWIESSDTAETPKLSDINAIISSYRSTAKDIQHAIKIKSKLKSLEYRGKRMLPAQLGILRFTSSMTVDSPEAPCLNWDNVEAYLFESTLILCTPSNRVRAQFDPQKAVRNISIDRNDPKVIILKPAHTKELPELHLHLESQAIASLWKKALEDPKAQFPIDPIQFQNYHDDLEAKLHAQRIQLDSSKVTGPQSDLILCISKSSLGSGLQIQQYVWDALRGLEPGDRLSLVVFSFNKIIKAIPFHKPHWSGWDSVVRDLSDPRSGTKSLEDSHQEEILGEAPPNIHDMVLNKAAELLKAHKPGNYASIILVSDDTTNIGKIPNELAYPKIPIHTVGIRENHNASALSTLAKATGGLYTYSEQTEDLGTILYRLIRAESHCVAGGVTIKMRSRIGTELTNFRLASLNDRDLPTAFDKVTRTFEWKLGQMKRGDSFCLLFDVEGSVLDNQPLLQCSVAYTDQVGTQHNPLSFRVCAPPRDLVDIDSYREYEKLRSTLELEECLFFSCKVIEGVMSALVMNNNRKAYQLLSVAMEKLKKFGVSSGSPDCEAMIQILHDTFDSQCDAIMDHKVLTKHFVLNCLQKLWLLQSRRALKANDEFEALFL